MTDYLELLLEEQESEEISQVPEWKRWKIPPMNQVGQIGGQPEVEGGCLVGQPQDKTQMVQAEQASDGRVSFEPEPLQTRNLTVELLRLRRAVRQADSRNSRATEHSGDTFEAAPGFSWMGERRELKAVDYAALVDAAFARDARRYDGLPGLL